MRHQLLMAAGLFLVGSMYGATAMAAETPDNQAQLIERGKYIARAADCMACHIGPDGTPFAGGKPTPTPLGDIVATNISSSKEFGIGEYSVEDLTGVLHDGKTPTGKHLYPAMPYPDYRGMTADDIEALQAYLQTVPAVEHAPEAETNLDFPFNMRFLMIGWNVINLDEEVTATDMDRGRYLVEHLAHCGTCHTPRDDLMGSDEGRYLAGAQLERWHAPNITSDETAGIGSWSNRQLADYFKHGQTGYLAQAAGPMGEAVHHSLQYLTDSDRMAIAAYLKTVPQIADDQQKHPVFDPQINRQLIGRDPVVIKATRFKPEELQSHGLKTEDIEDPDSAAGLYLQHCAGCHMEDGSGQPVSFYASLQGNTALRSANPRNLVAVILDGVAYNGATPRPLMPGFEGKLDNQQIAKVANYVRVEFGGHTSSNIDANQVDHIASGEQPVSGLIRYAPILAWLGVLVAVLLIIGLVWFFWARRRRQYAPRASRHTAHSKE
ncbi:Cytochrome c, mono-and diheme variants [Halopseudomonas litoralis]|uniref:Cytochrome c, mono-and diheme variants n=1 Tax=Halopseudomonas litoralis TaxID=797277 RepID=A0A1H1LC46_9GAMM|nr:cytochrome c [Halopseudomonas litoralis]SDR72134.1 Cytochrome c, mono-and diheme variants [Halopseudomonas litoralis]